MNETDDVVDGLGPPRFAAALRESESRFRALTSATFDVVYRMSPDWTEMRLLQGRDFIADTLEPTHGWLGKYIYPEDQASVLEAIKRAVYTKSNFELEHRVIRADGTLGWTHSRAVPILDARGEIVEWFGAASDVTHRKDAEAALEQRAAKQAAIAALSQTALAETSIDRLMDRVVHCVTQTLCTELTKVLELAPGGGELLMRAGVGWEPGLVGRAVVGTGCDSQAGFTLAADGPVVVNDLRTETRFTGPPLLLDHDVVSGMSCAIRGVDGRPYGVLGTHSRRRREFSEDDVNFLRSVANVLAAAIVRRRAEEALRESEARQAFLLRLDEAIRPLADARAIQNAAAFVLGEYLRVTRAMYADVEGEPGAEVGIIRSCYLGPDGQALAPFPERYAYSDFGERVMGIRRRGDTTVVADINTAPAFDASERATWVANGIRAAITVPLVKEGRLVAVLGVQSAVPHAWTAQETALVQATAERTWAAVERARAEAALRESEERYRRTFELAGSGIAHIGLDRKYIRVNRRLCEILGYPEHELIGMTGRDISHPGDFDKINSQRPKLYAGEIDHVYVEKRYVRKDKAVVWVAFSMTAARDAGGKPLYEIAIFDDITERKDAEKALAESEERFRTLADNMDQLAWMAEPRGAFLWFNKRWHDYTGAPAGEVDASNWGRLVHPEHAPRVIERSQRCLRQGEVWEDTFPLKGSTGEYRWFLGRAVPIKDDEGGLRCWFGTMTDITELEERNAQLERMSAQLTAIEHHERRKLAEALHDGPQQLVAAAKLRLLLCLEESGSVQAQRLEIQRIERLLDDAVDALRSVAWELGPPPALGISTLPGALEWLAESFQRLHGFLMKVIAPEAIPPLPEHAKLLLFSATRELLLNCVKHSGVNAATLEVRAGAGHELQIAITDNGTGFDAASLRYGFGLWSIRERLIALGGRLVIESAPGRGARFTIFFPLPEARAKKGSLLDRSPAIDDEYVRIHVGRLSAHCVKCGCEDFLPGREEALACRRCGTSTTAQALLAQIANATRHLSNARYLRMSESPAPGRGPQSP